MSWIVSRRELLRRAAAAGGIAAMLPLKRLLGSAVGLRLLLVVDRSHPATEDVIRGVRFGVEESSHAARLLGGTTEVALDVVDHWHPAVALTQVESTSAILAAASGDSLMALVQQTKASGLPVVNLTEGGDTVRNATCGSNAMHVAPSDSMRVDVATAWLAEDAQRGDWELELPERAPAPLIDRAVRKLGAGRVHRAPRTSATRRIIRPLAARSGDEAGAVVLPWHASLDRFGAEQLNARYVDRFDAPMPAWSWCGWFAAKAVWEIVARSAPGGTIVPAGRRFDGHKGVPLDFRDWDGQLRQPLYVVAREGAEERVLAQLPGRVDSAIREALDRFGLSAVEGRCRD